ncbi:MAG: alpha-L-rhamnosidase N-terminal domain-containing protein [Spirochaetes bacterium]|nr:alpha-L-rhamnosidase N-terminal domain-containing protein [Spirochaetota bacterium]
MEALNLAPARWLWLPGARTLPNTFVFFRRRIRLDAAPMRAELQILADSRYRLTVNGRALAWGPAPCDPRSLEVDSVDLAGALVAGENVIGAQVLYFGEGDGTWAAGNPGFIARLALVHGDGREETIVSDGDWRCAIDRAHAPGRHKQWFLRALQEEWDARLHPWGWDRPGFTEDGSWMAPALLPVPADKPPLAFTYSVYTGISCQDAGTTRLLARSIPLMREERHDAQLREQGRLRWKRDPRDWFDFRVPDSFDIEAAPVAAAVADGVWELPATGADESLFLTFSLHEHMTGWPAFTVEAAAGTIIELMLQESHEVGGTLWLETHFHAWTRFICREGLQELGPFDFSSGRWLQISIRGASRPVRLSGVHWRRRLYPFPHAPEIRTPEPALQRLFTASLNTLCNSIQEIGSDGFGRERQQYAGDVGHQHHGVRLAFGETRLSARYLRTWSDGQAAEGYFMDCWPGYDRLARVSQRILGLTDWGPILDHGVQFVLDCRDHFMQTGDREAVAPLLPRLAAFGEYLAGLRGEGGLLPVDDRALGIPSVWLDHVAYGKKRNKQAAFNLYVSGMFIHGLAVLADRLDGGRGAARWRKLGRRLAADTARRFWDRNRGHFVDNHPWIGEGEEAHVADETLAFSVVFGLCPGGRVEASLRALADRPPWMGIAYPANACWRHWALFLHGRPQTVLRELRDLWATQPSVVQNHSLSEFFGPKPDSTDEWSHCPVSPLFHAYMDLAGIRATEPGFRRASIRPQLGDLEGLSLTCHTPLGGIVFDARKEGTGHRIRLEIPVGCAAVLWAPHPVAGLASAGRDGALFGHALAPGANALRLEALRDG